MKKFKKLIKNEKILKDFDSKNFKKYSYTNKAEFFRCLSCRRCIIKKDKNNNILTLSTPHNKNCKCLKKLYKLNRKCSHASNKVDFDKNMLYSLERGINND